MEKRCRGEVSDSVSPSAGEPAVAQPKAPPQGLNRAARQGAISNKETPMVLEPVGREVVTSRIFGRLWASHALSGN